jgi:hypothetical protein
VDPELSAAGEVDPELAAACEGDPEDAAAAELEQTPPSASWSRGRSRRAGDLAGRI